MARLPIVLTMLFMLAACGSESPAPEPAEAEPSAPPAPPPPGIGITAFSGATIWDGTGRAAIRDQHLLVRDGRIIGIEAEVPEGATVIDVDEHWIIPGFVNAHSHVSGRWAPDDVTDPVERVRADLTLYAQYGVTTVLSLGGIPREALGLRASRDQSAINHARFYVAGNVVADNVASAARATALENVALEVDWIKLRVDDNLGTSEKMPWDAAQAAIDMAKQNGKRVATHVFYMEDAAMLLGMGTDLIAHSVRDQTVTDEFVQAMLDSGVCYVPTLAREVSTFVYAERPEFFDDPFFLAHAKRSEMDRLSDAGLMVRVANSPSAAAYRLALEQAKVNLRVLLGSGVPIAFGTDSGPPGRFPGYFEHMEFELMTDAGMTPREILRSATAVAAECLGLEDVGTLEPGRWADLVVLEKSPLADIGATRSIAAVYVAGNRVPGSTFD